MPSAAILAVLVLQAPPGDTAFQEALAKAGSRDIVEVPSAVLRIEEKSLPPDAGRSQADVPISTANRSTLSATGLTDMTDRGQRGMRLLAIALDPGQRLTARLAGLDVERIQLSLATPAQPGPMTSEIAMVNKRPALHRSRNLQICNITEQPFTVVLRVTGILGQAYKLDLQRDR